MAVVTNIATPASGGGSLLLRTPGGNYDLVISNNAGQVAFLGTSAAVSSSNGCPIANGQSVRMAGVAGGAAASLYVVVAGGAATGTVGYVLTTSQ